MDEQQTRKLGAISVLLIAIGLLASSLFIATILGYFRIHIENLNTRTVWILNAPSNENINLTPNEFNCLKEKNCIITNDGSIKLLDEVIKQDIKNNKGSK